MNLTDKIKVIQHLVASHYGLRRESILGRTRPPRIVRARQTAAVLAMELLTVSTETLVHEFKVRDHTTISRLKSMFRPGADYLVLKANIANVLGRAEVLTANEILDGAGNVLVAINPTFVQSAIDAVKCLVARHYRVSEETLQTSETATGCLSRYMASRICMDLLGLQLNEVGTKFGINAKSPYNGQQVLQGWMDTDLMVRTDYQKLLLTARILIKPQPGADYRIKELLTSAQHLTDPPAFPLTVANYRPHWKFNPPSTGRHYGAAYAYVRTLARRRKRFTRFSLRKMSRQRANAILAHLVKLGELSIIKRGKAGLGSSLPAGATIYRRTRKLK